jgi:hypothetical protein
MHTRMCRSTAYKHASRSTGRHCPRTAHKHQHRPRRHCPRRAYKAGLAPRLLVGSGDHSEGHSDEVSSAPRPAPLVYITLRALRMPCTPLHVRTDTHLYMYVLTHISTCTYSHTSLHVRTDTHLYMYVLTHISTCTYSHTSLHVRTHTHLYMYVLTHISTCAY